MEDYESHTFITSGISNFINLTTSYLKQGISLNYNSINFSRLHRGYFQFYIFKNTVHLCKTESYLHSQKTG